MDYSSGSHNDSRFPNLFIVGAAKAGTTTLHYALAKHPQVYMSEKKEPGYFAWPEESLSFINNGKLITQPRFLVNHLDDYLRLFENGKSKKIRGESSTTYLFFYQKTIANIKRIHPDAEQVNIVIALRNPVERAFSQYMHKLRDAAETLSFEEAIDLEEKRKDENWHFDYQYIQRGFYYNQVKAYLDNFRNVKIYLNEDLRNQPLNVGKSLEEFLNIELLPMDFSGDLNVSGEPKMESLNTFLKKPNPVKKLLGQLLPKTLRRKMRLRIQSTVYKYNLEKKEINPETKATLTKVYYEDVMKLQDLIKRDLGLWMK
ncbi:MAG: sulfotransferase [Chitinophagales bacterium]|nr:sulfotransferase [Chitinophagales bacterium]